MTDEAATPDEDRTLKMGNGQDYSHSLDFVQFLLDRELIDDEAAERVRERARTERSAIGQVLVMRGELSVRQVMNVLERQADEPGVRFGELAVRLGYLTTVQLEAALQFQQSHRRHQVTIVRDEGLLRGPELNGAVVNYVQLLELQAKAEQRVA